MTRFALALGLLLLTAGGGCDRLTPSPQPKTHPRRAVSSATPKPLPSQEQAPPLIPSSDHYAVPFAWEKANDEPLAQARSFIADMLRDNQNHHQQRHAKADSDATQKPQAPRATVVACADSRVLVDAWDATPENDEFTIRNLGNLVSTSLGSVQYGIEQLQTPVLVILGHTGCTAIAAAQQDRSRYAESIRKDLELLHVPPETSSPRGLPLTADAVVSNVRRQVRLALDRFGPRIVTGRLTVIGAVLDQQDEFGKGAGHISIVDVNGNSEPRRLRAFVDAIQESANKGDVLDAGVAEPEPAPSVDESNLDPIARDLRAAFAALADKANKQAPQPKHR
jgi:carbonic anhydrase